MSLIKPVTLGTANEAQKKILEPIKAKIGMVPNIYASMAASPITLEAILAYGAGLKKGTLTLQEIELIALAVGTKNNCDYCVAAHTAIGKGAGLTVDQTIDARKGLSRDAKQDALVKLSIEIVQTQGRPSKAAIEAFRKAGYSDGALVEVIAWVTQNILTNYFNHINETEVDFPKPPALA